MQSSGWLRLLLRRFLGSRAMGQARALASRTPPSGAGAISSPAIGRPDMDARFESDGDNQNVPSANRAHSATQTIAAGDDERRNRMRCPVDYFEDGI